MRSGEISHPVAYAAIYNVLNSSTNYVSSWLASDYNLSLCFGYYIQYKEGKKLSFLYR